AAAVIAATEASLMKARRAIILFLPRGLDSNEPTPVGQARGRGRPRKRPADQSHDRAWNMITTSSRVRRQHVFGAKSYGIMGAPLKVAAQDRCQRSAWPRPGLPARLARDDISSTGPPSRSAKGGNAVMQRTHRLISSLGGATLLAMASLGCVEAAPFLIVGNDEKLLWDDQGKPIISPAGKESVGILDPPAPANPKMVANLPLKNSIVGPPVNLAIDPTNSIALVADSIDVTKEGDALKMVPDNKVYVIDLKANPAKLAATVTVGKQPSGLSFNPAGNLALVTNRLDKSISVLSVKGTEVKVIDTIDLGDILSHVEFTPDGKRALATKFNAHKVSLLNVDGDKVTYSKLDLPTGQWPYNVAVAPGGKIALTADNGGARPA